MSKDASYLTQLPYSGLISTSSQEKISSLKVPVKAFILSGRALTMSSPAKGDTGEGVRSGFEMVSRTTRPVEAGRDYSWKDLEQI